MNLYELPIKVEGIIYSQENNKFQFLLLKRSEKDGGFWQPMTGTVHDGEKLKDCVIRELKEETGLDALDVTDEIWRFDWKKADVTIIEIVFGVKVDRNSKIMLNSEEHSEYKWTSFDEALTLLKMESNKEAFKKLQSQISQI